MGFAIGRRGYLVVAALAAAGAGILAGSSRSEAASKPPYASRTHLGVPASSLVTLEYASTGTDMAFVRVLPDGTRETDAYRVPDGAVLVVTDVEYAIPQLALTANADAGSPLLALELEVRNLADPGFRHRAFLSARNMGDQWGDLDLASRVNTVFGGTERLGAGFLLGPGAEVRPHLLAPVAGAPYYFYASSVEARWVDVTLPFEPRPAGAAANSAAGLGKVVLRGYLAKDR